jgi:solute carrier family 25 protein 39/40
LVGEESNGLSVFGANFSASFVAGSLAAAATCPLDVVKTRRQIEVRLFLLPVLLNTILGRF